MHPHQCGMIYKVLVVIFISLVTACNSQVDCGYDCDPSIDKTYDEYLSSQAEYSRDYKDEPYINSRAATTDARIDAGYFSDETGPSSSNDSTPGCPYGCTSHKSGCEIKGNISFDSGEKIYHIPGQEYYQETMINPEKGERWFCTEAEAISNGWRRSFK